MGTDIAFMVVSSNPAVSTVAAQTVENKEAIQVELNKYTDNPTKVHTVQCSNCEAVIEVNSATPMIVYVTVFFVLLAVVWVVGILIYGRQTGAATMIEKVEKVAEAVANPMFDVAEA